MKKFVVPVILFVAVMTSCNMKDPNLTYFEEAADYNDYIIDEQKAVFDSYDDLINSMSYGSATEITNSFNVLQTTSKTSVEKMSKLAPFKKNIEFRDKAKELYAFYANACDKELKELVGIFTKEGDINETDLARVDELSRFMDDGEKKYNDALIEAQKTFAKKNNLELY